MCEYKTEFNYEGAKEFPCDKPSILNSKFCFFHDKDHRDEYKQKAVEGINDKVKESILENKPLECIGYYLPDIDFAKLLKDKGFAQPVNFSGAKFSEGLADFSGVTFSKEANFIGAKFSDVIFAGAKFCKGAEFGFAEFSNGYSNFSNAKFSKRPDFTWAKFLNELASFSGAKFPEGAIFGGATFSGGADFAGAEFLGKADFSDAKFSGETHFDAAVFPNEVADFSRAEFSGVTYFSKVQFSGQANFSLAQLNGRASFFRAEFNGETDFTRAHFKEQQLVSFSHAQFNGEKVNFSEAHFSGRANFSHAQFKRAQFFNVDFKDEVEFFDVEFPLKDNKFYLFDWNYIITEQGKPTLSDFLSDSLKLQSRPMKENLRTKTNEDGKTISISWHEEDSEPNSPPASLQYAFVLKEKNSCAVLKPTSKNSRMNKMQSYEFIAEKQDDNSIKIYKQDIPIKFNYSTFRKRARFSGEPDKPLELGYVSFVGVDMSNIEFSNVNWNTKNEKLLRIKDIITRNVIVDEEYLNRNNYNYEEVSRVYNQLRKNYEIRLLFNEASHFFIGEMEAIRKSLLGKKGGRKLQSIPYLIYKWLALYGESISLPLVIWTPILIGIFVAARIALGACSIPNHESCSIFDKAIDSFAAYFQFPRSSAMSNIEANNLDIIERIVSVPVLGTAFVALRRKFERAK
jgi:uncharacterized protein YjbI with pentapeptide repeats